VQVNWRKFFLQDLGNQKYNEKYLIDTIKMEQEKRNRENAKERIKMTRDRGGVKKEKKSASEKKSKVTRKYLYL
jgi:hypothetical protein